MRKRVKRILKNDFYNEIIFFAGDVYFVEDSFALIFIADKSAQKFNHEKF